MKIGKELAKSGKELMKMVKSWKMVKSFELKPMLSSQLCLTYIMSHLVLRRSYYTENDS